MNYSKNAYIIFFLVFITSHLFAQIDSDYILELVKGTTAEMNAAVPAKGALLYNTDDDKVYQFNGTVWTSMTEDGDWTRTGDDQYSAVSGNVGIGVTNPSAKLEVKGNSKISDGHLYVEGVNPSIKLNGDAVSHYPQINFSMLNGSKNGRLRAYGAADALLYEFNNHIFRDYAGNELMRIREDGDVGIGTSLPVVHLADNTSSIPADLEISTIGQTGVAGRTDLSLFSDMDGSNPANIFLQGKLSTGKYGWATWSYRGNHSLSEYKDWVDFGLNDGNTTKEQVLRMNVLNGDVVFNEGNVGVGITEPTEKLDVTGRIAHSGSLVSRGPTYSSVWMRFVEGTWGNSTVLGAGGNTILGAGEFPSYAQPNFPSGDETLVLGSDFDISFYTNTQTGWVDKIHAMQIENSGNVGIGTATPQGNLHVSSGDAGDALLILESDVDNNDEDANPTIVFRQDGGLDEASVGLEHNTLHLKSAVSNNGGIVFDVSNSNGLATVEEAMRINPSGDVGIATSSPRSDLDVNGVLIEGNSQSEFGNNSNLGNCVVSHGIASFFTNSTDNNYMHIKLPYQVNTHAAMYRIHVTGYRYRSGKNIDITWVGYCYSGSGSLIEASHTNAGSPEFEIGQYVGSDNHVYLRFRGTTGSNYYQSFRIDSMNVGNGEVLKEGEVEIISSSSLQL